MFDPLSHGDGSGPDVRCLMMAMQAQTSDLLALNRAIAEVLSAGRAKRVHQRAAALSEALPKDEINAHCAVAQWGQHVLDTTGVQPSTSEVAAELLRLVSITATAEELQDQLGDAEAGG